MRVPSKFGVATATILVSTFGYVCLTQAAPLAGVSAAFPAVQVTQQPSALEALPEKAHHYGYGHHGYGHHGYGHHGHGHHGYNHHGYVHHGYGHHGYGHHGYGHPGSH
jgi:hypothetical protein